MVEAVCSSETLVTIYLHGVTSEKIAVLIFTAKRTSDVILTLITVKSKKGELVVARIYVIGILLIVIFILPSLSELCKV